jgi:hypothetical protein
MGMLRNAEPHSSMSSDHNVVVDSYVNFGSISLVTGCELVKAKLLKINSNEFDHI